MIQLEQTHSDGFTQLKQENQNILTKMFILEQELVKKNNIIMMLKKKLSAKPPIKENSESVKKVKQSSKEIYIIDPSKAVVEINDELLLYKKIYDKLIKSAKKNEMTIKKYNSIITNLQNENLKMRNKFQLQIKSVNRERETMLSYISQNTRKNSDNFLSLKGNNNVINNLNLTSITNDRRIKSVFQNTCLNSTSNEEFAEILFNSGITMKEFEKMTKTKHFSRLTDVIEILFKTVIDKNLTLNLIEIQNQNLTTKNFELNKENMSLTSEIEKLKLELSNSNKNTNYITNDDTLSNNTSQITQNKTNMAYVVNYQKLLEQKNNEALQEPDIVASFDETSSKRYNQSSSEQSSEISSSNFDYSSSKQNDSIVFTRKKHNSTLESVTSSEFKNDLNRKHTLNSQNKEIQSFVSSAGDGINIIKSNLNI